ncbi:MAG: DUF4924 family protein [Bacteroidales bacterium]|nr:DUF4924 family protein [Bacteroidales bacterium]
MLVAREKRKKNIAEYVLYMWQIEDTLRALQFDMNLVEERIIPQFRQSGNTLEEIRDWYTNLIISMIEEGIKTSGHLKIVSSVINELNELHKRLIFENKVPEYLQVYSHAKPNIDAFREKLQMPGLNEIEVCFYGLYGLLLLRLKKKDVTPETVNAMQTFSNILGSLSKYFHDIEQGKAEF